MSFFNDFVESVSIDDIGNKICCNFVFGCGLRILANFKIENLQEDEIVLKCKKERIKIFGTGLKVLSLAKGEIEIVGNVDGVMRL